jgi:VIT1/CCC1 family predicted Fe2+/Mn2+ transporter
VRCGPVYGYNPPVLRQGPIPRFVHGVLEYLAGAASIAAPFVLGFDSGAATAVAIVVGVLLIFLAATTDGPSSLVDQVPLPAHVLLDYALVAALIASPFLFGFSDETAPTVFFIALGVLHLLVTVATRFVKEDTDRSRRRRRRGAQA